ncbi:MAG: riboflavin kinase/FMN adenylyltransferase [Planctomycetota bacterium]|nr:riboflavin kinase/FMN adenylyltransferase [Planctomycetota bacterium]
MDGGRPSVITIESFGPVPRAVRGAFLAVGNFDGVHRGHAQLIGRLRARAEAAGAPAVALTFDPPPVAVLRPDAAPIPLTWLDRKVELLIEAGATEVGVFHTGPWLLGLTAREFFDRVVIGQFAARGMVEGPTFGFGRDRGGDAALLGSWCAEAGLEFEIAAPTEIDGRIVSSSRIRRALSEGDVDDAALLLGRPHRLRGRVVKGAGRGAGLGFPTANLDGIDTQIPADGVYAVTARISGEATWHRGAAHIGPNATFGATARTVEVHLIDFAGDLYDRTLEVDLIRRLRPTRKFDGIDDLLRQIREDVELARQI